MIETDALIIGKGPAGIQAAIYIQRANLHATVIGKDYGASEKARVITNYYGIETINGSALIESGIRQAEQLGASVVTDEVVGVSFDGDMYEVATTRESYRAYALLFASGAYRNVPRIRKIRTYEGKGISYCAVCDGFFFRNKTVAVIGSQEYAAHEAAYLLNLAAKVYVLTDGQEAEGDFPENVEIITDKISEVYGETLLEGARTVNQEEIRLDGIFVAVGTASTTDLATKLGVALENGRVSVNHDQETNIPGLFAAGDCTPGMQQIAKAVGDGCVAGMNMSSYIQHKKRG